MLFLSDRKSKCDATSSDAAAETKATLAKLVIVLSPPAGTYTGKQTNPKRQQLHG
jgi:hypothetical protein